MLTLSLFKFSSKGVRRGFHTSPIQQCNVTKEMKPTLLAPKPRNFWKDKQNQLQYMNFLADKLNIKSYDDWYSVMRKDIEDNNGLGILNQYRNSFSQLVSDTYPNHPWLPWKFKYTQYHFWTKEILTNYMNWLAVQLNIKQLDDWYNVTRKNFIDNYGEGALSQFEDSHIKLIINTFPNHNWLPWKFNNVPIGFWKDEKNVKNYINWLGKHLNFNTMEDWYKISRQHFIDNGGIGLVEFFKLKPVEIIIKNFPDYNWLPWKFNVVPDGFWNDIKNVRNYFDWLRNELKIENMDDWYKVSSKDFYNNYGITLLNLNQGSPSKTIMKAFSEYPWQPWKFSVTPVGYWQDKKNQRKFLEIFAKEQNIDDPNKWYSVTFNDLSRYGARTLTKEYNSMKDLLESNFPEHHWDFFQFNRLPGRYGKMLRESPEHQQELVSYLEKKFNIKKLSDWYTITTEKIHEILSMNLYEVMTLVKKFYPELDMKYFQYGNSLKTKKAQNLLKLKLELLFPEQEILEDYKYSEFNNLELDFYLPDLKLAFEYQGELHYKHNGPFRSVSKTQENDKIKMEKAKELGITLIPIPYWWNKEISSLKGTIATYRPDVLTTSLSNNDIPIPINQPIKQSNVVNNKIKIESQLMLATNWNIEDDPTGWWMTEKYDGIRAYWDGEQMYTRTGRLIRTPKLFNSQLPNFPLDGEIWVQRGLQQASLSVTNNKVSDKTWNKITFCVFDVPNEKMKTYEERYKFLKDYSIEKNWPSFLHVIEAVRCESREHLNKFFAEIIEKKGEGVMLREPGSLYETGRSNSMKRYKEYLDTEVKVLKNMYPHGFECEQIDGQSLFVSIIGTETMENAQKIRKNNVITVKYGGVNIYNKLIQPVFLRARPDVSWSDIVKME